MLKKLARGLKILYLPMAAVFIGSVFTSAYFASSVSISSNTFSTGTWEEGSGENGSEPAAGDVVINEVMWMGSKDLGSPSFDGPNDQWIELKNISGKQLHIKDWHLTYKSNPGNENILTTIGDNRVLKPGEHYLIGYYTKNNSAINVQRDWAAGNIFHTSKFQLKLYTSTDKSVLVDVAGDGLGVPSKGDAENFYSMQRNANPGDGSNYDNWFTCTDETTTATYWKPDRVERGTPGGPNV